MYEEELLQKIIVRLEEKQEFINSAPAENFDEQFDGIVYQLDLDRLKYLVSNYLRTRMLKIQALCMSIVLNDQSEMLSQKEFEFLNKYFTIKTNHFKRTFLLKIPEGFRKIQHEENHVSPDTGPDLDKHVFIRALEEIGRFDLTNGEDIEIKKDDIYLLRYSLIKPLLIRNKVDLI